MRDYTLQTLYILCLYIHVCVHMCLCTYVHVVCMRACVFVYDCICMCVCACICMCVCSCICVCFWRLDIFLSCSHLDFREKVFLLPIWLDHLANESQNSSCLYFSGRGGTNTCHCRVISSAWLKHRLNRCASVFALPTESVTTGKNGKKGWAKTGSTGLLLHLLLAHGPYCTPLHLSGCTGLSLHGSIGKYPTTWHPLLSLCPKEAR